MAAWPMPDDERRLAARESTLKQAVQGLHKDTISSNLLMNYLKFAKESSMKQMVAGLAARPALPALFKL